ncbi:hypothetical protein ACFSQ7_25515 [Paenibacillus rhizoplanae]
MARGYLNNPELTEAKFIPDPLYPEYRMYRTGDLSRWLPDGNIDFLGRADNQVKVRGYRLELQEIEHELSRLPGIEDCTVIMIQSVDREKELAAYFVAGNTLQPGPLRKAMLERLPSYAVPTRYMQLAALPLTINGKKLTRRRCATCRSLPQSPEVRLLNHWPPWKSRCWKPGKKH